MELGGRGTEKHHLSTTHYHSPHFVVVLGATQILGTHTGGRHIPAASTPLILFPGTKRPRSGTGELYGRKIVAEIINRPPLKLKASR